MLLRNNNAELGCLTVVLVVISCVAVNDDEDKPTVICDGWASVLDVVAAFGCAFVAFAFAVVGGGEDDRLGIPLHLCSDMLSLSIPSLSLLAAFFFCLFACGMEILVGWQDCAGTSRLPRHGRIFHESL